MICLYMNMSVMFIFFSLILLLFMMKFILMKMSLFIEFNILKLSGLNYSILIYFDYKSFMFMMVVLMISSMIILYSIEYMMFDNFNIRFLFLLVLFVISMLFMIVGQNLLMILLGWDGLGLISYCLVIYYNNWSSYNSGMITILINRLGDVGLLISIGMYSILGDWNFLFLNLIEKYSLMLMVLLACFTKSAQIPFSVWLPLAMAAPTPISALVHSSTLVTAGVYLLMRFKMIIFFNVSLIKFILFLSLMTMFFSGFVAIFENDLKKIIALSTLSQLGLMMVSLLTDFMLMSFFHLIIHAMFKSLLFMCAGLILHSMLNNQDIRNLGGMSNLYFLTLIMFNCSNLALCGFIFMSGFYSKDLILELMIFFNFNYMIMIMFYLSIMFTVIYSFRLIYFMIKNYFNFYTYFNCSDNYIMNGSMMMMFIFSIISGSLFSWMIFNSISLIYLFKVLKLLTLNIIMVSMMFGIYLNLLSDLIFLKLIILFKFMKSMWMMNLFSQFYIKNIMFLSSNIFYIIDKGWFEFFGFKLIKNIYLNLMNMENLNNLMLTKIFLIILFFMMMMII